MKTAEEFLIEKAHWSPKPKGVHHFTGEFVIKMMESYHQAKSKEEGIKDVLKRYVSKPGLIKTIIAMIEQNQGKEER